jgi:hypothetical protein
LKESGRLYGKNTRELASQESEDPADFLLGSAPPKRGSVQPLQVISSAFFGSSLPSGDATALRLLSMQSGEDLQFSTGCLGEAAPPEAERSCWAGSSAGCRSGRGWGRLDGIANERIVDSLFVPALNRFLLDGGSAVI